MTGNSFTSSVEVIGAITFPPFIQERVYMEKFTKQSGLPKKLKHYQTTVDQMLDGIDTDDDIYLMVDSSIVQANTLHRRGGKHIDGYWCDSDGHRGTGHRSISCHSPFPPTHKPSLFYDDWSNATLDHPESLLLASNYEACKGWVGNYSGIILDGGDCSNINTDAMEEIYLQANTVYKANVGFIHESIPVNKTVKRTLIRLNLKNH